MSSLERMRADLDRADAALAALPAKDDSFGLTLMRAGLRDVRDDLSRQIEDAQRSRLDILIDGAPVTGSEIRVDALARLLHTLQESISSVAQALTGRATSRSSIPGPLREATSLHLAATFAGSFGAILRGPIETDQQEVIPGTEIQITLLDEAVERVLTLVDMAGKDDLDDDPIIEAILPLGSRSFTHLASLSNVVVSEEMNAGIRWQRPFGRSRVSLLTTPVAKRLENVFGRNRVNESQEILEGRLGTVSDIRNAVELQTDSGDIIRAKVIEELVPELGAFYTRRVAATFQVTTVRSLVSGIERHSYTLVGLAHLSPSRRSIT